jgi:hydroxymethylpyrimidine pyrophosphatase-like HAD family hydrolase
MISYVFDIDGVLCYPNQIASVEFRNWFYEWAQGKNIYFVTGSNFEKTKMQLGDTLAQLPIVSYNCQGNSHIVDGVEVHKNDFKLLEPELVFLETELRNSKFHLRTGFHLDNRQGSVNFSVVGRNALPHQRQEYKRYDQETHERVSIIKRINEQFPRLSAFLGGDISIDICLKGQDKGQVYDLIPKPIYFFADKAYDYGIDQPLAERCVGVNDRVFNVHGPEQTKEILCVISPTEDYSKVQMLI